MKLDKAIKEDKAEYKNKVENLFHTNRMRDAWTGLRVLTEKDKARKACSLTITIGVADILNTFSSRFDNKDFSSVRDTLRHSIQSIYRWR